MGDKVMAITQKERLEMLGLVDPEALRVAVSRLISVLGETEAERDAMIQNTIAIGCIACPPVLSNRCSDRPGVNCRNKILAFVMEQAKKEERK